MAEINIVTEISASVWKLQAEAGGTLAAGDVVMILESMKMEIPVEATRGGVLKAFLVAEGDNVVEGQAVAVLEV
jgi:acetyl-CoA carboxylase biotin carboxyl carrier protein